MRSLEAVLRNGGDLDDGNPGKEKSALLRLAVMLASENSFAGGPQLAARLTRRFAEFEDYGGSAGFLEAVQSIVIDMGDVRQQVCFLVALLSGSATGKARVGILKTLDKCIRLFGGPQSLARSTKSPQLLVWEFDRICSLLEGAEIGPKSLEIWSAELIGALSGRFEDALTAAPDFRAFLKEMTSADAFSSQAVTAASQATLENG